MAERVNQETFQKEVLEADGLVLADFYSDSCVPCKRLAPVLAELEETYGDALKVVKVNINFADADLLQKRSRAGQTQRSGKKSRINGNCRESEIRKRFS